MKKILGLDLGTNSIGWALVSTDENGSPKGIDGIGSRIIPMSQDILGDFDKGNSVSQTAARTKYRSTRRLHERNLLRRERLHRVMNLLDFLPKHFAVSLNDYGQFIDGLEVKLPYLKNEKNEFEFIFKKSYHEMLEDFRKHQPQLFYTKPNGKETKIPYDWTLYYLRKKALSKKIEKEELAWLLLNFNRKRGYYQLRGEDEEKKEDDFQIIFQKIISVTKGEKDKKYDKYEYNVLLENGLVYRASFYSGIEHWIGQTREFIYQEKALKDGTKKESLSYLPTFDEIEAMDATKKAKFYQKIKIKTENEIKLSGKTVGAFIYDTILQVPEQKIKGKLIRTIERNFYKEELEKILDCQIKHHPVLKNSENYKTCIEALYESNEEFRNSISNPDFKYLFVDNIIFYQRPLKSKKSEISDCAFEFHPIKDKEGKLLKDENGKQILKPLKCISRSHPLFQEFRLWQWLQNVKIYEREKIVDGKQQYDVDVTNDYLKNEDDCVMLFEFLNERKDVDQKAFLKHFKLSIKTHRWNFIDDEKKSYPCNETHNQIVNRLAKVENVPDGFLNNEKETALWHILYSVRDKEEIKKALISFAKRHNLHEESFVENFKKYPLIKSEYGSYSEKAIKKLLPLMRIGKYWSEDAIHPTTKERIEKIISSEFDEKIKDRVREKAINMTGIHHFKALPLWLTSYIVYDRHSESGETSKWKTVADLEKYLKEFKQHSLRNPIVEQLTTETLRVVKDIWAQFGQGKDDFFSEIHIELGREMKNNAEDRKAITENNTKNESTNMRIRAMLAEFAKPEYEIEGVRPYSPYQQDALKIFEDGIINSGIEIPDDIEKISKSPQPTGKEILKYKLWLEQKYRSPYTGEMIPLNRLFTSDYEIEHIIPQSVYFDDSFSNKVICESIVNKNPYKDNQLGYEFISNNQGRIVPELSTSRHTVKIFTKTEYEDFIKTYYAKNKSKAKKLMLEEVPDKMIERQLNDTRYISKMIQNLLSHLVREEKNDDNATSKNIISTNGTITSVLKQDWGLNDVWNDLVLPRFERLNKLTGKELFTTYNENHQKNLPTVPLELRKGFQLKRIDHRHHAMDALVIACATRNHVNYLNNQTALDKTKKKSRAEKQNDRQDLKQILCFKTKPDANGNYKWQFKKPWETITQDAKLKLETTVVSFKQNLRVINNSVNYYQKFKDGEKQFIKQEKGDNWAIRKPLHKETIYGKVSLDRIRVPKDKILTASRKTLDMSFDLSRIETITDTGIQKILRNYLSLKENNPEIAFSPEGIEEMNKNISKFNAGVPHKPILKVRVFELGSRFALGETRNKKTKYVEAAKGTNLYFAVYQNETGERSYDTIPLNLVIERLKQDLTPVPEKDNYILLFWLSPNDLVYIPANDEKENPALVDFKNLSTEQKKRLFNVNDFSGNTIYFTPNSHAKSIAPKEVDMFYENKKQKIAGSFDNKTASFKNVLIKETCWKLKVDRLGNISLC